MKEYKEGRPLKKHFSNAPSPTKKKKSSQKSFVVKKNGRKKKIPDRDPKKGKKSPSLLW